MATNSEQILDLINVKIKQGEEVKEYSQEQISILGASKGPQHGAIDALDTLLFDETNAINNAINDVGAAYQSRVDAGCRSDLLWRVIGFTTAGGGGGTTPQYTLECVRLQSGGYEQKAATGLGSIFAFVEPSGTGGITSSHMTKGRLKNMIGFATDFYHGVKVADEPYAHSVSDTFVLGGIGTCGLGTNRLYLMNPTKGSTNNARDPNVGIRTGMIIQSEKPGFFPQTSVDIVGIGTTMADLRSIDAGISTYSTEITVLTLEDNTIGMASAPMLDGTYVNFIISKDPDSLSVKDWGVEMSDSPVVPQTLKMMTSSSIGTGTSVSYDNSGEPNVIREWNPFMEGLIDPNDWDSVVSRPEVGAGRSHYLVGLGSQPLFAGATPATLGQTRVVLAAALTNGTLYADITTTCSTQQTNLVNAISTRDTLESALAADLSTFESRLNLSTFIREDRNAVNMHVWAYRQQIGNCDTDESSDKEFKGVMESTEFLDIINGT